MTTSDEYRANAAECERMASNTINPDEKATWLQMAAHWLRLIPKASPSSSQRFDEAESKQGTNQKKSEAEH